MPWNSGFSLTPAATLWGKVLLDAPSEGANASQVLLKLLVGKLLTTEGRMRYTETVKQ